MSTILLLILVVAIIGVGSSKIKVLPTKELVTASILGIKRFPMAFLAALACATITILSILKTIPGDFQTVRVIAILSLGISLLIASEIASATLKRNVLPFYFLTLVIIILIFYSTLNLSYDTFILRLAHLAIVTHLVVSLSYLANVTSEFSFWSYNRALLSRFLVSVLYAHLISVFISIALLSINYLLDVSIDSKIYSIIWAFNSFATSALIFISGFILPDPTTKEHNMPPGLTALLTYIVLPFIFLYLAILYLYTIKITVTGVMPKNSVGWITCIYCVFGTLTFCLGYPLKDSSYKLGRFFTTKYFHLLVPVIGLLLFSALERVNTYGVTEKRFYLLILTFWLLSITLYFILNKNSKIRTIPATLLFIGVITAFGPFSANCISLKSQSKRFINLLNTALNSTNEDQKSGASKELSNITDYIIRSHSPHPLVELLNGYPEALQILEEEVSSLKSKNDSYNFYRWDTKFQKKLFAALNLKYYEFYPSNIGGNEYIHANINPSGTSVTIIDISGYNQIVERLSLHEGAKIQNSNNQVKFGLRDNKIYLNWEDGTSEEINLTGFIKRLEGKGQGNLDLNPEDMSYEVYTDKHKYKLLVTNLYGMKNNGRMKVSTITTSLLIGTNTE